MFRISINFKLCVHSRLQLQTKMDWEAFYDAHPSPSNYESIITDVENFVCSHENEKMVLITVSISTYTIVVIIYIIYVSKV